MKKQLNPGFGSRITRVALAALLCGVGPAAFGQDSFGYTATSVVSFSYADISATGTAVLANTDDGAATLSLPFPFRFYGTNYTSVCVSTNGLMSFKACVANDFTNLDLTAQSPGGDPPLIAPFWMDLSFAAPGAGSVVYQTLGTAPNRRFVVQWNNALALNTPGAVNFQVVLAETTNNILFQYQNVQTGNTAVSMGASATAGIRDTHGNQNGRRLQWSYRAPVLANSEAILFISDSVPPVISGMPQAGCMLWPPDHRLVQVAVVSASDTGTGLASFTVTATSDESENGLGDGDTSPDTVVSGTGLEPRTIQLRAERSATGTGRTYTITATAIDLAGNTATATSTCTVPVSQGS